MATTKPKGSTRLTKGMRDDIVSRIISKTFGEKESELKKARIALADKAVAAAIPSQMKEFLKKNPHAAEWFPTAASVDVSFTEAKLDDSGTKSSLKRTSWPTSFKGSFTTNLSGPTIIPECIEEYGHAEVDIPKGSALHEELLAQSEKEEAHFCKKKELRSKLQGLVYSVSTIERLHEAAPELKEFLPEPQRVSSMPAIVVSSLVAELTREGLQLVPEAEE